MAGLSPAMAQAAPASDAQLWTELDLTKAVSDRLAFTATLTDRLGDGLPNPTLWGGGLTGEFRLSPTWSIGGGAYAVQVRSASSGHRVNANLPLAYLTGAWEVAGVRLSDRNRFEDVLGVPGHPWRYRNRLQVDRPLQGLPPIRSIFASDEVFYDFGHERFSRNRAQVGITLAPAGPAAIQIYYMRQDDTYARPGGLNILGLSLKVDL
jgi:hypothetical protein